MIAAILLVGMAITAIPGLEELKRAPDNPVELTRADKEKAQFYLDGMWATIDSLHFGNVSVTDIETIDNSRNEYQYDVKFSYPEDLVRFDVLQSPTGKNTTYIRTLEEQLLELPPSGGGPRTVSKFPPGEVLTYDGTNSIDLRTLGVTTVAGYRSRGRISLEWLKKRTKLDGLEAVGTLSALVESSGSHIDLFWVGESVGQKFKTLLRLDSSQGYTPILRVHARSDGGTYSVASYTKTSWEKKSGIWVPVDVLLEGVSPDAKHELKLNWKSVNQTMAPETFTLAGLSLPEGTQVVSHKVAGKSFVEGVVGEPAVDASTNGMSSSFRTMLIFANVVVFCVLIVCLLVYRARSQHR